MATRQECASLLLRLAAAVAAGYLLLAQVFLVTQVSGMGMFPSMKDGDLVIAFRLRQTYAKDDVVAYRAEGTLRFGRVAARGGDVVTLGESGALVVNGAVQGGDILYPTYAVGGL
ncbi:MAG: signal peptidase I, partial [Clostridiales bacterium]|nr:signal peptidase I [Clostridiales bacterium]